MKDDKINERKIRLHCRRTESHSKRMYFCLEFKSWFLTTLVRGVDVVFGLLLTWYPIVTEDGYWDYGVVSSFSFHLRAT